MQAALKVLFVLCLTAMAVFTGYKFFPIRAHLLFLEEETQPQPAPVLTVETLPVESPVQVKDQPELVAVPSNEEKIVAHIVDHLTIHGSNVMDKRYYADYTACDAAVRTVAGEYKRRGVREQDMAETAPFPDSKGAVVMFTNEGILYYVGCVSPMNENWAVYVQFMPNGRE